MSSTSSPDDTYGTVKIVLAGSRYRDEYAAVKLPEWAEWMLDECEFFEEGTPLIPYPCVAAFKHWVEARNYEVRVRPGIWSRVESFDGGLDD